MDRNTGLTLVLGGASSGKSAHAERLVIPQGGRRLYLATAQAFDAEMRARIARHKSTRGAGWHTIECPLDVAGALEQARPGDALLLDCATLWLSNHMLAGHDVPRESERLLAAFAACVAPVVVVSNEAGMGIVPENALARAFREAQGRLNQRLASAARRVDLVTAGLPLTLKGAP